MDELQALRIFLQAADTRNFAQVSRNLGMTAASVTRTIAALERHLGIQLFVRTTRQVSLTAAGAAFAARLRPGIDAVDAAKAELLDAHRIDSGRLRINAPMSFGTRVLPDVLRAFRALHPGIAVEVSLTDEFVDILKEDCDLAIRISGPPSDKSTIWRKIAPIERILVAAPDSPFTAMTHPHALPVEACLGFSTEGREEIWELSGSAGSCRISAGQTISVNNGDMLARMAADGVGVAQLPVFIVADELRSGRLVRVLPEWQPKQIWLTLFYPPYHRLPPRIAAFSDFFETQMAQFNAGS